eukprot:2677405-Rhodomonas_salina.2
MRVSERRIEVGEHTVEDKITSCAMSGTIRVSGTEGGYASGAQPPRRSDILGTHISRVSRSGSAGCPWVRPGVSSSVRYRPSTNRTSIVGIILCAGYASPCGVRY